MARPWYAFYPADYGRDTGHLSLVEHGAYRALLDHYYATAAPLPRDEARLLHLCRANTRAERKAVRAVLREFFRSSDAGWHHPRVDAELAKAAAVVALRSLAGRASAARRQQVLNSSATDVATESQLSQSQPQSQENIDSALPGFGEFWAAYPRREARGAAARAYAVAAGKASPESLAAAAAAYAARRGGQDARFTRLPATWLEQECWLDDLAAAPLDDAAMAQAWDGQAAPLVAEIGAASFQAFFAAADFVAGPPARIRVAAPFLQGLIARRFSASLAKAYGEFAVEVL